MPQAALRQTADSRTFLLSPVALLSAAFLLYSITPFDPLQPCPRAFLHAAEAFAPTVRSFPARQRSFDRRMPSSFAEPRSVAADSSMPTGTTAADDTDGNDQPVPRQQRLVLVGGGHAHVQVIKSLHADYRSPDTNLHVTLIDRQAAASYSGMVPGCLASIYTPEQTMLQLRPLAEWAKLDVFHQATVVDVDLVNKIVWIAPHDDTRQVVSDVSTEQPCPANTAQLQAVPFDVVSMDIGSTSRGWKTTPGARQYTLPTRPISNLVRQFEEWTDQLTVGSDDSQQRQQQQAHIDVVVIGAGVAGIELSMSIHERWKSLATKDRPLRITLLDAGDRLLPEESDWCRAKLESLLRQRNIHVIHNCVVEEVTEDKSVVVRIRSNAEGTNTDNADNDRWTKRSIAFSHCVWSTGAEAHDLAFQLGNRLNEAGERSDANVLDITDRGWIRVTPTLQSTSHPFVFAAGDCCHIIGMEDNAENNNNNNNNDAVTTNSVLTRPPPKAGVYAVRAGPTLSHNLFAYLRQMNAMSSSATATARENDNALPKRMQLQRYEPQADFLKLLVCGDGTALGFRFGIPLHGRWVMKLKDNIDNKFMDLFRAEHLPDLSNEGDRARFDPTRQYDASDVASRPVPMDPCDAAEMLMTEDVADDTANVDYEAAWNILKDMAESPQYKKAVLRCIQDRYKTSAVAEESAPVEIVSW